MKKIFLAMALAIGLMATAQVKIGANPTNINAASILEIESTTQGVLFPRVALANTTTATLAGGAHVQGMTVYNTATEGDVTPGMYTSDGTKWVKLGGSTTAAPSVVLNTSSTYTILGTEDIILSNAATSNFTLPVTGIVGKRIVIANNPSGGTISISIALGGVFWNGIGFATSPGSTNAFTYTGTNGWICDTIGMN